MIIEIDDGELLDLDEWKLLIKLRAGWCCERCGHHRPSSTKGLSKRLVAHHKDRDKCNNRLSNGECLCTPCHMREHVAGKNKGIVTPVEIREKQSESAKLRWVNGTNTEPSLAALTAGLQNSEAQSRRSRSRQR